MIKMIDTVLEGKDGVFSMKSIRYPSWRGVYLGHYFIPYKNLIQDIFRSRCEK